MKYDVAVGVRLKKLKDFEIQIHEKGSTIKTRDIDQAELVGLVSLLNNRGISIVSINPVKENDGNQGL